MSKQRERDPSFIRDHNKKEEIFTRVHFNFFASLTNSDNFTFLTISFVTFIFSLLIDGE